MTTGTSRTPHLAVAGSFLERLAGGDFAGLGATLEPDVTLGALTPDGFSESHGADEVCARFTAWFGDVDEYEVLDSSVEQIGSRLELHWRIRVAGERFDGARLVDQIVFADAGSSGRIGSMSLLCSGYAREQVGG